MEEIIILNKDAISNLDSRVIKQGCFYTTFDCIKFFTHPNLHYNKEQREKIKRNIKFMSENNKIIVIKKNTDIRKVLREYLQGYFPLLTTYNLKECEDLYISEELEEDSSFLIDCVLCSLANERKKVIIFTTSPGIIEMFGIFIEGLKTTKSLINSKEENSLLNLLTEKLNLSIVSDIEKLGLNAVFQ